MSAREVAVDMKIKKKCVVPGCFGKNKDGNNAPLHRLPWHKRDLAKKWLSNLIQAGIPRDKLTVGCRVCGEHFEGGRMGPDDVPVFPSSTARGSYITLN